MRRYADIVQRIEALAADDTEIQELAQIGDYPVFSVERGHRSDRPTVLLMGGTHGDEPAGVESVLHFLESGCDTWLRQLNFAAIPCLNPHGYVHDTRHNAQDVDVNWSYARDDVPEVQVIRRFVAGRRFAFVFDCHEDWESPGYYIYELRRGAPVVGAEVTRRVSALCPLNTSSKIEGLSAENGLIAPDPREEVARRAAGIPLVMFFEHTDHLLTSESPTERDMDTRVQAHMTALETVIEAHVGPRD